MYPIFFDDENTLINVTKITRMVRGSIAKEKFPLAIELGSDYTTKHFDTEEQRESYIQQMIQGTARAIEEISKMQAGKSEIPKYPPANLEIENGRIFMDKIFEEAMTTKQNICKACNACNKPIEPPDLSRLKEE